MHEAGCAVKGCGSGWGRAFFITWWAALLDPDAWRWPCYRPPSREQTIASRSAPEATAGLV